MITIYHTLAQARSARAEMPTKVGGFLHCNYIRKTNDGKYAVISIPRDCYLNEQTLARYNLPAGTLGILDDGEPDE